ncbi:hypothetical protein COU56_00105 [Candidatus Pacearchaeota archaeon CG10_big_fil_rev_8_21_14_0_10_31_9]|nr:MAG: hypothetical protein COU56_00105 [Candidatus Pacearchaeota archaeon CG10_big_fil_rev_8_21_14_0_10_31_9]PIZ82663.1 MAG: hypothetical protein COX97_03655 [Candidatus Pacearchaeota archaeon CG_4_10_14_0_2_um_filter_05_32_18]
MEKPKLNSEWHEKNKMPKNASFEEKVKWHTEHNKYCSCHPGFPKKLEEEMKKERLIINPQLPALSIKRNITHFSLREIYDFPAL